MDSLQCRRILGGRNLVRVRNIVVAAIFDFMTVEDWEESEIVNVTVSLLSPRPLPAPFDSPHLLLSLGSFNMALSRANCALKENARTAGYSMDCHRHKLIRYKEFKTQLQGLFLSNQSFAFFKHQSYLSFTGFPSSIALSLRFY